MPLYFAYGANMDRDAMATRCPSSRPLGRAKLARHRFIITRDGYASVLRDPRAMVHGVIWDLALSDMRALDKFEEVDRGLYAKIMQPVITEEGSRRALVYVGSSAATGSPRTGYLEAVVAAAETWSLPPAYVMDMKRFLRSGPALVGSGLVAQAMPLLPNNGVQPRAAAPQTTVGKPQRASDAWSWKP
ncbi:MAG: gamma-glutamylcyclotransferase family protein [Bosea sp. (in: a-proteobacteria)]